MRRFGAGLLSASALPASRCEKREVLCFSKFYFASDCCSVQELDEYFSRLGDLSVKRKSDALRNKQDNGYELSQHLGLYLSGPSAQYIFMLAEHWCLQDEVKYLALEIFNSFMTSLVSQLHELIHEKFGSSTLPKEHTSDTTCQSSKQSAAKNGCVLNETDKSAHLAWVHSCVTKASKSSVAEEEWKRTLILLKGQSELRAVTCIMIASKISSHYGIVTLEKGIAFLKKQGHRYSKDALLKSELRILKAVNYKFSSMPTLHTYVTVMLEILCRSDPCLPVGKFYPIIIRLLNLFYYFRPSIFARLCNTTVSASGILQFARKEATGHLLEAINDLLLPSAAIIAAAVYLKNKSLCDRVILMLCKIIGAKEADITEFSYIILDVVLPTQT